MPKAKPVAATDLQEMVNVPEEIAAFGRTYLIQKFTLGPMTQALEYIGPMGYLLRKLGEFPRDKKGKLSLTSEQAVDFAVTAVSISGPSVMGLISIATKEPLEWLEQQEPMDGLRIFAKVVEKNLDFFSRKNIDQLTGLLNNLVQHVPTLGGST
jgi:hypothetical protein